MDRQEYDKIEILKVIKNRQKNGMENGKDMTTLSMSVYVKKYIK